MLQLRWQLFRNSLRFRRKRVELAANLFLSTALGFFALVSSAFFFLVTFFLLGTGKMRIIDLLLWVVFLEWQLVPVLLESFSPGLNFSEVARYPVSFPVSFLLNAVYGLFDPAALVGLLWLFCIWLGILFSRSTWAVAAAGLFILFAAFNLVCNRIVVSLFERFQSTRKGRERMVSVFLVIMLLPQVIQFATNGWIDFKRFHAPLWAHQAFVRLHYVSPPGLIAGTLEWPGWFKLVPISVLLAYLGLFTFFLVRQLRRVYQGEIYAESFAIKRDQKIRRGWRLHGIDEAVAAIVEKEFRYLRQNPRLLVQLGYPLLLFLLVAAGGSANKGLGFQLHGAGLLGAFAGVMALSVSNMACNVFGMDGEGFGRWLLSPLPLRKVLLGKGLAQGGILSGLYLLGAAVLNGITRVPWAMFFAISAGFMCVLIIQIGTGSVVSVYWPKKIDLMRMNSRVASTSAGLASLLVNLPLAVVIAIVVFASLFWKLHWLPPLAGLAGIPLAIAIYFLCLNWAVRYACDNSEKISQELGA